LSEYVNENEPLIRAAAERVGEGWSLLLDFDIVDILEPDTVKFFMDRLATDLRAKQTDKKRVYERAGAWLSLRKQPPAAPASSVDWLGMAETVFWLGYLGIEWPLQEWIPQEELDGAVTELPLQTLGYLVSGLERGYDATAFGEWLERHRATLANRFRKEMRTPILEDDGTKLTAHFIVPVDNAESQDTGGLSGTKQQSAPVIAQASGTDNLHNLTIERLELLTRLFPDRELFASQGYGQRVWANELPNDSTYKTGIVRRAFHPQWLVNINATFQALGELLFRPQTWQEYVENILELRNTVLSLLLQLEVGLTAYLRKRVLRPNETFYLLGDNEAAHVKERDWLLCTARLNQPPSLPTCLMDEWGLTREGAAQGTQSTHGATANQDGARALAGLAGSGGAVPPGQYLTPYRPLIKATNDCFRALYKFFSQSRPAMMLNPVLGKLARTQAQKDAVLKSAGEQGIDPGQTPYSVLNFAEAVEVLRPFQDEFRRKLGSHCSTQELEELERKERAVLRRVWAMWYFFALDPSRVFSNPSQECPQQVINVLNRIRGRLEGRLHRFSTRTLEVSLIRDTVTWEGAPVMAIVLDGEDAVEAFQALEKVIQAIQEIVPSPARDDLENYALQFAWPNVAIIPLIKGKSASGTAWYINRRVLTSSSQPGQLSWFNLIPKPMPEDTLRSIDITVWSDSTVATLAKLVGETNALSMLVRHLADFSRMPGNSMDDTGAKELIEYMNKVTPRVSELLQGLLSTAPQLAEAINRLAEGDANRPESFVAGVEAFRLWLDRVESMVPDSVFDRGTATIGQFSEWAAKLDDANNYIALVSVCWSSYILSKQPASQ
jgi:hypothetical protein